MTPTGKLLVLPFSYPYYPREIVDAQVHEAARLLGELEPVLVETVFSRADARRARERLRIENPDLVVAVMVSWIEAPNVFDALRDHLGKPLLVWSHTTIELDGRKQTLGALVAAGVVKQSLADFGAPFEFVIGRPDDGAVRERVEAMLRVAAALNRLRDSRLGLIGYPALGMYTATLDHITARKVFGPEIVHIDQYQVVHRMERIPKEALDGAVENLKAIARIGEEISAADLELSSRMFLALKGIVQENELDAVTVKCQYELSQIFGFTPCVPLSLLGETMPVSCEGDLLTTLTEMLLFLLSGERVSYADIHEILEDRILVGACGFSPFSLSEKEARCISTWGWEAFSGLLNSSSLREGRVTIARISRDGSGFKVHVASGKSVGRSDWNEVGCPRYPGTDIVLDGSTEAFGRELVSNHYALVFADVVKDVELSAKWLGIRFISSGATR
ncbi:MAG: hypothetical protein IMZ54_05685 [Acidobacteria bacterium]|nr:hypothetical protein [Acidobacteriota bacterium]